MFYPGDSRDGRKPGGLRLRNGPVSLLLISLLVAAIGSPVLTEVFDSSVAARASFLFVLLTGLWVTAEGKLRLLVGLGLFLPNVVLLALRTSRGLGGVGSVDAWSTAGMLLFCAYVVLGVLRAVLRPGRVTLRKLQGATCAYLLIGLCWGFAYQLLETWQPGSFQVATLQAGEDVREVLVYASLVTLTTLGSGEIVPTTSTGRALVSLEAVFGVLYTAVLVARLVAAYGASGESEG